MLVCMYKVKTVVLTYGIYLATKQTIGEYSIINSLEQSVFEKSTYNHSGLHIYIDSITPQKLLDSRLQSKVLQHGSYHNSGIYIEEIHAYIRTYVVHL